MAKAGQDPRRAAARPGMLSWLFSAVAKVVVWLLSLLFSIIVGWQRSVRRLDRIPASNGLRSV